MFQKHELKIDFAEKSAHGGVWKCVILQPDLGLTWTTAVYHVEGANTPKSKYEPNSKYLLHSSGAGAKSRSFTSRVSSVLDNFQADRLHFWRIHGYANFRHDCHLGVSFVLRRRKSLLQKRPSTKSVLNSKLWIFQLMAEFNIIM